QEKTEEIVIMDATNQESGKGYAGKVENQDEDVKMDLASDQQELNQEASSEMATSAATDAGSTSQDKNQESVSANNNDPPKVESSGSTTVQEFPEQTEDKNIKDGESLPEQHVIQPNDTGK